MATGTITDSMFGAPVQDAPATDTTTAQAAGQEVIADLDPNDPRLTSEAISDVPTADAYAILPPVPDAKYRAKLTSKDVKDGQGKPAKFVARMANWLNPPRPYLFTALTAVILDPSGKYDDVKIDDNWVTCLPNKSGTSHVATILRAVGIATPPQATQAQWMQLFLGTLAKSPEVTIETAWEWQCQHCAEVAEKAGTKKPRSVIGMHRFPQGKVPGTFDPQMKCPDCGQFSTAKARVNQYLPLKG